MQQTFLRGAIHVHSRYSDGSDSMEKIIAAARAAGLDYVMVTDHNTLKARQLGWEGWHDGVLVIVGCEISSRHGHCVAFDISDCRRYHKLAPPEYLARVKEQGGTAYVAHPKGNIKPEFVLKLSEWRYWENPDYDGLEIWSYMHDWIEGCHFRNLREYLRHPDAYVSGPPAGVLQLWDKLAQRRRIVGLGALDNHAANFPFRKLPWALVKIFPHEFCFRTVRTHIMTPPLKRQGTEDVQTVLDAMRNGRCYIDYAPLGDGSGFRFTATHEGREYQMGDEVHGGAPVNFSVHSPCPAEIILLRNGLAEAAEECTELQYSTDGSPGVYRVEARIDGRPWLFSNHIYIR